MPQPVDPAVPLVPLKPPPVALPPALPLGCFGGAADQEPVRCRLLNGPCGPPLVPPPVPPLPVVPVGGARGTGVGPGP